MAVTRTYGTLSHKAGRWVVGALEPHVCIRFKHMFPRVPKSEAPPYLLPDDLLHAADLDWFTQRYPLAISEPDREQLRNGRFAFEANQAEMERILAPDYRAPAFAGLRAGEAVRDYQAQAIDMALRSGGLLLGDDVGLGKTYTSCGAFLRDGMLPAVVVCQPHLAAQWCGVIGAFTTLSSHAVKTTKPYALPPADVFVFRYSQLRGWADMFQLLAPKAVVFDEIQELRTGEASDKGIAARRLAELARVRIGLSATPIYNYGTEIFQVMQYIQRGVLGPNGDFVREWCGRTKGISDPKALGTFLREQHVFLRRTKREVGKELAPVNRIVQRVAHDASLMTSIEDVAQDLAERATHGAFTDRGQAARELDLLVRQSTGVAKASYVADVARIVVEGGEPIVLVGWHRSVYDVWLSRLESLKPAMYTGSESPAAKKKAVARFLSGDTDVLILSLRSGSGLDGLQTRCSTIIFGELDWSPGVHHQCIGRLDREGQTQPVTALFLVADDGSDPPMMEMLGLKASQAQSIVDPHLGVTQVHSDATHMQLLVKRYLGVTQRKKAVKNGQQALALEGDA